MKNSLIMEKTMIKYLATTILILVMVSPVSALDEHKDSMSQVKDMQSRWAKVNYNKKMKKRSKVFEQLVEEADAHAENNSESAEVLIWAGIINSTYAGEVTFTGMTYAKKAKEYFEQALSIDGTVLSGSAYTSLGTLYFKVPGGFIGFGDDEKANELLNKGLEINPNGIDSNYFYADYMYEEKKYSEAKKHLDKALDAPARPDRPIADKGRKDDIMTLMAKVNKKLKKKSKKKK